MQMHHNQASLQIKITFLLRSSTQRLNWECDFNYLLICHYLQDVTYFPNTKMWQSRKTYLDFNHHTNTSLWYMHTVSILLLISKYKDEEVNWTPSRKWWICAGWTSRSDWVEPSARRSSLWHWTSSYPWCERLHVPLAPYIHMAMSIPDHPTKHCLKQTLNIFERHCRCSKDERQKKSRYIFV